MRSLRKTLLTSSLAAFVLAGCGDSGGPDASGALQSKAAPLVVPEKTKIKGKGFSRPKSAAGQSFSEQ